MKKDKMVKCKHCGADIASSAKVCPNCGGKNSQPIFKKWWFWLIIILIAGAIGNASGSNNKTNDPNSKQTIQSENKDSETEKPSYTAVDLQTIIDELKDNALKAKQTYQDMYIEFTGKISVIDSDGKYIAVEPSEADTWNLSSIQCYLKNEEQRNTVMEKAKGDEVTVQGKIKSIGEVLGYSLDIDNIW